MLNNSMDHKILSWVISVSFLLLLYSARSEETDVKQSLITFLQKLAPSNPQIAQQLSWNISSDPCVNGWGRITCNNRTNSVRRIILDGLNLTGSIDASLLCNAPSLVFVSLRHNNLQGSLPQEISYCTQLTNLLVSKNRLSGNLPSSLSLLKNLKRLDISDNEFSSKVPEDFTKISGLITFLAQDNKLNSSIPNFDFSNLQQFNVSNNFFTGPIPDGGDRFGLSSYYGNPGLCGKLFNKACPSNPAPSSPSQGKSKKLGDKIVMLSGYIVLVFFLLLFSAYKLANYRKKTTKKNNKGENKKKEPGKAKASSTSSGQKTSTRSENSILSNESAQITSSMSLVMLENRTVKDLRFEELLKAPAELLGRGKYGSLYKVMMSDGSLLAVKRIKDWSLSEQEFQRRMERLDRLKHRRVLSAIAFYCSKQEKLVVYEYKPNGSLFKLLHGSQENNTFNWSKRLSAALQIAETMAFMHKDLHEAGIGHGNLKSSNILMNNNNEPCISEYGLLETPKQNLENGKDPLKADIYGFGVILLELLTGKLVQSNGFDLAQWVNSVVREEWTVEVFDRRLISEGGNEENMIRVLQVALKCIDSNVDARPTMSQVSKMICELKEEEDRSSIVSD